MATSLIEFFKDNEVKVGKDFKLSPPQYYSSLKEAYWYYFSTFKYKKTSFHFILSIENWNSQGIGSSYNSGAMEEICFSILNFHRFFELFIKEILSQVNPFLSVKTFEKDKDLFDFLNQKANPEKIRTIEFSDTLKRFRTACDYYKASNNEVIEQFKFLNEEKAITVLKTLSTWRNRIMHNGKSFPNLFAFDYLISQEITPLISQIIAIKSNKKEWGDVFLFKTQTGIDTISEILKIKFSYKDFYGDESKTKKLKSCFFQLAHIKEIGKASFQLSLRVNSNIHFFEPYYENPVGRVERFAKSEKSHESFNKIERCICCGLETLVLYNKMVKEPFEGKEVLMEWFKCYNCNYSLKNNMLDAHYFGISEIQYFTYPN